MNLIFNALRTGYGTDQVERTMTAGELAAFLENFDEDTPVYLSYDSGYTYGGFTEEQFQECEEVDDE